MTVSASSPDPDRMPQSLYSPLVELAFRVAANAHRNQTRKGADLPYIQHPASVVLILARCGFDDDQLLAAAVLHDTIEDTDCTVESLTARFPEPVVKLVQECSEAKTDASGEKIRWRERKETHIAEMREASTAAKAIVLADKLHNLGSMLFDLEDGQELWSRFSSTPCDMIWYHREIVAAAANVSAKELTPGSAEKLLRLGASCLQLVDTLAASLPK